MTDKVGNTRLFRNFETDERIVAAETNGEVIWDDMNEKDVATNTSNRMSKEEFNKMLKDKNMEADENIGITFNGETRQFVGTAEKPDSL
jgi:hypothetical protein